MLFLAPLALFLADRYAACGYNLLLIALEDFFHPLRQIICHSWL